MYIIVGLGNPGKEYEQTRHNVGFMVVDKVKLKIKHEKVTIIKPTTFMNQSGEAVKKIVSDFDKLWVIHDDLDLPLGVVRTRLGGSSGGHNGVQSIIDALGTDQFWRIRVGIVKPPSVIASDSEAISNGIATSSRHGGTPRNDTVSYVLSPFSNQEKLILDKVITQTVDQILHYLKKKYIVGETIKVSNS